jgi:hypothetical protein
VKIVEVTFEGEILENECKSFELYSCETFIWYVIGERIFYKAYSKDPDNDLVNPIVHQENSNDLPFPEYIAIIEIDT